MRKIKQFVLLFIATAGLLSCEAEKVDEVVKDDKLQGKAILRFQMDGITRIAQGKDVFVYVDGGYITVQAVIKDKTSGFAPVVLKIRTTRLATGFYTTNYGSLIDPQNPLPESELPYTFASFKGKGLDWEYSTTNVKGYADMGSLVIKTINPNAQYFEGTFNYTMNAPLGWDTDTQGPKPSPIKIENGYFEYVRYETATK